MVEYPPPLVVERFRLYAVALLTWSPVSNATAYNLKRSTTSGGGYSTIQPGLTAASTTDFNVTNGTTYYYVVSATNLGGESPNSTEASATPAALTPDFQVNAGG